jgi:hypothetical protein
MPTFWQNTKTGHSITKREKKHFFTDDSAPLMTLTTAGYLGIGIQTPSELLHVNGNLKIDGVISGVSDPVNTQDIATKAYADALEVKVDMLISLLYPTVQQKLDIGVTPKQIYDSDNSLLDSLYGKTYQGGLIAYLNTSTGTGLITVPFDQNSGAAGWGCYGTTIGGTSSSIGTGQANTTLIVNGCNHTNIPARLCANLVYEGYADWFLPSKDELNEMYLNLKVNGIGDFSSDYYWSSTEYDLNLAWMQTFYDGYQIKTQKWWYDDSAHFRAVRAF